MLIRIVAALLFVFALSAGHRAEAASGCPLPFILQNGTIPDATQVMANFYALQACSGGAASVCGANPNANLGFFPVIKFAASINAQRNQQCTVFVYTGPGGSTFTMPDPTTAAGYVIWVQNLGGGALNVATAAGEINFASTVSLPVGGSAMLDSDGTLNSWFFLTNGGGGTSCGSAGVAGQDCVSTGGSGAMWAQEILGATNQPVTLLGGPGSAGNGGAGLTAYGGLGATGSANGKAFIAGGNNGTADATLEVDGASGSGGGAGFFLSGGSSTGTNQSAAGSTITSGNGKGSGNGGNLTITSGSGGGSSGTLSLAAANALGGSGGLGGAVTIASGLDDNTANANAGSKGVTISTQNVTGTNGTSGVITLQTGKGSGTTGGPGSVVISSSFNTTNGKGGSVTLNSLTAGGSGGDQVGTTNLWGHFFPTKGASSTGAVLSSCGTTPYFVSNTNIGNVGRDTSDVVHVGSAGPITSCTVTFAVSFQSGAGGTNLPICVATAYGPGSPVTVGVSAISVSAVTFTFSADMTSTNFAYHCFN